MPHLRQLIADTGRSLRQMCLAAGIDPYRLAYYVKPSSRIDSMPSMDVLKDFAMALRIDVLEVFEACAHDLGYPWPGDLDLDPQQRELLRNFGRMTLSDKVTLLRVSESLTGGDIRRK